MRVVRQKPAPRANGPVHGDVWEKLDPAAGAAGEHLGLPYLAPAGGEVLLPGGRWLFGVLTRS